MSVPRLPAIGRCSNPCRSPWRTRIQPSLSSPALAALLRTRTRTLTSLPGSSTSSPSSPPPKLPMTKPLSSPILPQSMPPDPDFEPSPPNSALLLFCLSTGLVDSLTFAVSGVWCAFVTGTTVQLGMDLPALLAHLPALFAHLPTSTTELSIATSQFLSSGSSERLSALGGFLLGGLSAARFPEAISPARSTAFQSALLVMASVLVLTTTPAGAEYLSYSHLTLALISSSMAIQAVLVQRFATPYATSVAWTSVWLSAVAPGSPTKRWKRFVGLGAVMSGAALGASLLVFGVDDEEKAREEMVHRVGWGLAVAALVKAIVAGMFWRRGRRRGIQL
ncbi:uncharacterized protein FIBRA_04730 [Fibroporia radiculosa]|uniref:Uncharacterized protein n=1 Tax=Fibroporia radiculosa TaxID=599839 RepID=J4HWP6_9APHY|nr:uncharacterized protein FIBRA_04730 [Fibroporia radiculosa]CCM02627.1 predicted protein [Fibroporia radiculosa]